METYGEDKFEMLQCVQNAHDGGYIACGVKSDYESNDIELGPWIIKTDQDGKLEWKWILENIGLDGEYYNYFEDCQCMFIHQINNGGFIAGFKVYCTNGESNFWIGGIVKLDESGNEVWLKNTNDHLSLYVSPTSIIELDDGSFLIVGHSAGPSDDNSEFNACLYKIDSSGEEEWKQEYDHGGWDTAWALTTTNDNGYLLTGWADNGEKESDYWMIKTDSNGVKLWEKTHGGDKSDFGHARNCYQTSDNGYIMGGYTYSYGAGRIDAWIVKTDSEGNMMWNRSYGSNQDDGCWSFESTQDDCYIFCITLNISGYLGDRDDIHLVKIDTYGHIVWIQRYDGEGRQVGQHICETSDGGFIVSGRNGRYANSDSDGMLVKFAQFSNERPTKPTIDGPPKGKPDTEYTFTATGSSDPDGSLPLEYMWDWGDGNYSNWLGFNEASYTWSSKDTFEIRVKTHDEHGGESDWSDPLQFSTAKNKQMNQFGLLIQILFQRFHLSKI